jgi:hypothetical protein
MSTKIDALVVELNLDVGKFIEGQKRLLESARQMKERMEQFGKDTEASGGKAGMALAALGGGMGRLAAFAGEALGKLWEFSKQIVVTDAASYRFSSTIGKSTKEVTAWDAVFQQFTGNANSGAALFDRIAQASAAAFMHGDYGFFVTLQRMGVALRDITDSQGTITNTTELILRMGDAFSKMPRSAALGFAQALHIPIEDLYALEKGRGELEKLIAAKLRDTAVTHDQGAAAQEITERWNAFTKTLENVGRALTYAIMDKLLQITDWFKSNTPVIQWFNTAMDYLLPRYRELRDEAAPGHASASILSRGSGATMPLPDLSSGLRTKGGAGEFTAGTYALATVLQNSVPGFNRVTAAHDAAHEGWDSRHNEGRAIDFTIAGGRQEYANTAAGIREQLRLMGIDATVLDEMNHPTSRTTAPHIHVQFNSEAAMQRFAERTGQRGGAGQVVNINQMTINAASGDVQAIGAGIQSAIRRAGQGMPANTGMQ